MLTPVKRRGIKLKKMPIPLGLYALPGAIKGGLGIAQLISGAVKKPKRPTYEIPGEAREELGLSRQLANSRMPGIGFAEDRIRQGSASSLYNLRRGASNPNQLLAGVSQLNVASNAAERGLLEAEAGDRYRRIANLGRSLNMMAQYKDKAFELNEMQPYQDQAQTKAALVQGGLTNLAGGVGEGLGNVIGEDYNRRFFDMMGGGGGQPGQSGIDQDQLRKLLDYLGNKGFSN